MRKTSLDNLSSNLFFPDNQTNDEISKKIRNNYNNEINLLVKSLLTEKSEPSTMKSESDNSGKGKQPRKSKKV